MRIAITGASGPLGRTTAGLLLDAVDPADVVLISRTPQALADLAARGAETRAGDFGDPSSLAAAFAGIERLLLISTDAVGTRLPEQQGAIAAAALAGVRHVVYTSVSQPTAENPAAVVPDHTATEQTLRESGLAWTALRNNIYAHMQVPTVQQAIAAGQLVTNAGDGGVAYVTREDCAATAVAVLTQDGHEDRAYDITGSQAVTAADLAALATEFGGKPVQLVQVDDGAYVTGLIGAGLPDPVARLIASIGTATREGFFGTVSTTVEDLTGRAPTPLRTVLAGALTG
jgi:NAD(P)H dehydrogenase (quinone)